MITIEDSNTNAPQSTVNVKQDLSAAEPHNTVSSQNAVGLQMRGQRNFKRCFVPLKAAKFIPLGLQHNQENPLLG